MTERENFWTEWRERLSALRNVPAVLKIVWDSGPAVVVFGLVSRLFASLLPVALLWITKLIIDGIVRAVSTRQAVQSNFWWLVAAEFSLAVLTSILARAIDYSDSLLADKYTRHVSIRVMNHAASLDLVTYEDPVFYDRLERARVQATDRLGMIQAIGRLIHVVFSLADAFVDRRRASSIPWGKPFCFSWIRQEFPPDADPAPTGLFASPGRKQRSCKGVEALWSERFPK
jgi:ABC-type multidrug transport system fused ATPase/permease subunit